MVPGWLPPPTDGTQLGGTTAQYSLAGVGITALRRYSGERRYLPAVLPGVGGGISTGRRPPALSPE